MAAITVLLERWKHGDSSVENTLAAQVYPTLRAAAQAQARRYGGALTLCPTELVNEAYERLHQQQAVDWRNRNHFFAIAATLMRRIAIDYLRARNSEKRGGEEIMLTLDELPNADQPACPDNVDWLALDQALTEFAQCQPEAARVVELRLFAGLSKEQVAEVCGSSRATVGRQWRFARAWLAERLDLVSFGDH